MRKDSSDLSVIEKSINAVFEEKYIDADYGCEALAAIDTTARLKDKEGEKIHIQKPSISGLKATNYRFLKN